MDKAERIDISIIILTFNSDVSKFLMTLKSVQMQKEINKEIIICDDGSKMDIYEKEQKIALDYNINGEMVISRLKNNQGIIKNALHGLEIARGKYVYMISPGDLLYDEMVLKDMYIFLEKKKAKVCFGNAIYYNQENKLDKNYKNFPPIASIYSESTNVITQKIYFALGNYILGPTYLRERKSALEGYRYISQYIKYADDSSCTLYLLSKGTPVYYFNRNVLFYEIGYGVTSSPKSKWSQLINEELILIYEQLSGRDDIIKNLLKVKKQIGIFDKIRALLSVDIKYLLAFGRIKSANERKVETINSEKIFARFEKLSNGE